MLQQTQVKTVIPYFNKFVKKIPSLKAMSQSKEKKILKLWEGLGYYRRAKNLYLTSKIITKNYNNKIPNQFEEIIKLPGVGKYTANILLALIYNQPRIGVDGNVKRIFLRLFNKSIEKTEITFKKKLVKKNRNSDLAEALMEFGALICKPKDPKCNICNLKKNCKFFKSKNKNLFSRKNHVIEKKYNIYCYLKKKKKRIALTKNKDLSFLSNFYIPETKKSNFDRGKNGWIYLCKYKNNISNIKMNISLFYKFTKKKPKNFKWHYIGRKDSELIPTFTKKIIKKLDKIYI